MTIARPKLGTLIIGTGPFVRDLLQEIARHPDSGYRVIGVVSRTADAKTHPGNLPLLGSLQDLSAILQQHRPQVIIVALRHDTSVLPYHELLQARVCANVRIEQADAVYEKLTGKLPLQAMAPRGLLYSNDFHPDKRSMCCTRALSLVSAVAGLLLLGPLMLLLAAWVKLDSPGPVLFIQERIGCGGKSFRLLKFRTMRTAQGRTSEWEGDNVHRITRSGRLLRKFRLDELPQFINILKGEMNLVGPRPHPSSNFELFVLVSRNMPECGLQVPFYTLRYGVLPGITGWAQVRYQYANSIDEEIEKLRFDLYYIKHYSFWFDLRIIFETIRIVVLGHEVASRQAPVAAQEPEVAREPAHTGLLRPLSVQEKSNEKSSYRI